MSSINKARRLLIIDDFIKRAVEKCTFDVKLTNRPITGDGNAEDEADCFRLGNMTKSLIVVNAEMLRVAAYYPASFMTSKSVVRVEFVAINPLADDDVGARKVMNKRPSVVIEEGLVLVRHSSTLEGVLHHLRKHGRYMSDRGDNGGKIQLVRTEKLTPST
jgi:hypothetical protein